MSISICACVCFHARMYVSHASLTNKCEVPCHVHCRKGKKQARHTETVILTEANTRNLFSKEVVLAFKRGMFPHWPGISDICYYRHNWTGFPCVLLVWYIWYPMLSTQLNRVPVCSIGLVYLISYAIDSIKQGTRVFYWPGISDILCYRLNWTGSSCVLYLIRKILVNVNKSTQILIL